jgi:hypothetical protein
MRRRRSASVTAVIIAVITLAVAVSMAGCDGSPTAPLEGDPLSLTRVFEDRLFSIKFNTGFREPERLVIRTAEQWSQVWARVTQVYLPRPAAPPVNFDHEMVVFVAMGQRPTGGYSITVEGVYAANGRIFAEVRERSPGAGCITSEALTEPVDAVRVPRRDGAVIFVERAETYVCR